MGQLGSALRKKEESASSGGKEGTAKLSPKTAKTGTMARQNAALRMNSGCLSGMNIRQLLSNARAIPDAFLVHEACSSQFVDEDGDVANEFYLEQGKGQQRWLRRLTHNLVPQKTEKYTIPRLHPDLPVVLVQVQ